MPSSRDPMKHPFDLFKPHVRKVPSPQSTNSRVSGHQTTRSPSIALLQFLFWGSPLLKLTAEESWFQLILTSLLEDLGYQAPEKRQERLSKAQQHLKARHWPTSTSLGRVAPRVWWGFNGKPKDQHRKAAAPFSSSFLLGGGACRKMIPRNGCSKI